MQEIVSRHDISSGGGAQAGRAGSKGSNLDGFQEIQRQLQDKDRIIRELQSTVQNKARGPSKLDEASSKINMDRQ